MMSVEGQPADEHTVTVGYSVLLRYRVMAYVTAVLLIVLVFVGVPLQVWGHQPQVANVVGTLHGFLYIIYLVAAFDLTWRLRVPIFRMILVLLAGTLPFCAFIAERKLTKRYEQLAVATPAPGISPATQEG